MAQLRAVLDRFCGHLKFDKRWTDTVRNTVHAFKTKNDDHIAFFGTGLLGVYPVRWTDDERNWMFDEIFQVDERELREAILALRDGNDPRRPLIPEDFHVLSDVLNHLLCYAVYRLRKSDLSTKLIQEGSEDCIRLLHYKHLTSLLSNYFPYPADLSVAKATYEQASLRFEIKREGNWGRLLDRKAEHITSKDGLHNRTFDTYSPDDACLYVVSDIQTRIRGVLKDYVQLFYEVRDSGARVTTTSSVMELEEGVVVKDVRRTYSEFTRYLERITPDASDFIRKELQAVVEEVMPSMDPRAFGATLEYVTQNYLDGRRKYVKEFIDETLLYTIEFIVSKRLKTTDLAGITERLKAVYMGSRVNESRILHLRKLGDRIVKEAAGRKGSVPTAPERTGLLLYIALRVLAMNYYK